MTQRNPLTELRALLVVALAYDQAGFGPHGRAAVQDAIKDLDQLIEDATQPASGEAVGQGRAYPQRHVTSALEAAQGRGMKL